MKSHRPIPSPDSTGQESKRPVQQSKLQQQLQQPSQQLRQQQHQQQQQVQQSSGASPQTQEYQQQPQQVSLTNGEAGAQTAAHLWHNPTRLRPP